MKITIAYTEDSGADAAASVAALLKVLPGARVKQSEKHPPFKHYYLTTRQTAIETIPPGGEVDKPNTNVVK